jgi:hypothetical protein
MDKKVLTVTVFALIIGGIIGWAIYPSKKHEVNGSSYHEELTLRLGEVVKKPSFDRVYVYTGVRPNDRWIGGTITLLYLNDIVYGGMGANAEIFFYVESTIYLFDDPYEVMEIKGDYVKLGRIS